MIVFVNAITNQYREGTTQEKDHVSYRHILSRHHFGKPLIHLEAETGETALICNPTDAMAWMVGRGKVTASIVNPAPVA